MSEFTLTPRELISESYPSAAQSISSLVTIVQTNPGLAREVIELAIMVGINAAMVRIDWDARKLVLDKIKSETTLSGWAGFKGYGEGK
jgi:hypothetical protein